MIHIPTKIKIIIAILFSKFLKIFFSKKIKIKRNGVNYFIDLSEGIDLRIFLNIGEEKKILNLKQLLNKDKESIFIDIGANIGTVSLTLSQLFKKAKIFSIEPTTFAFKKLKSNLNLNKELKKNIEIHQYFIGNKKRSYTYSSWKLNFNIKNQHMVHKGSKMKTNDRSISLDNFIKKINKKIDFIKIDADGHEFEILRSGIKSIKESRPIIHIEFAPYLHIEYGYSPKKIINLIEQELEYDFYDENLKRIQNILEYSKNIKNTSENFFLINKK